VDARRTETGIGFSTNPDLRAEARSRLAAKMRGAHLDLRSPLVDFSLSADLHQRGVIESAARTIRVVAPAGSGKTQTLVNRVLHRASHGIPGRRILLLTFDNSAALSIREKLRLVSERDRAAGDAVADVTVSTLNAFGYRLLREYVHTEHGRIVNDHDAAFRLRRLRKQLGEASQAHAATLPDHLRDHVYLDLFSVLKNDLVDPRAGDEQAFIDVMVGTRHGAPFLAAPENEELVRRSLEAMFWLYQRYDEDLRAAGLLDFDDQKLRAYVALQANPALLAAIQARYDEVIVDEFQDINRLDFVLIEAISRAAVLVVTGDDDQAIYGFRGTTPEYIINLDAHLGRDVTSHELAINYRCPPNLVEHADALIRHNTTRIPKSPQPYLTVPSEVQVVSTVSTGLEATAIADYIARIRAGNTSLGYADFAVLYRTNAQSLPLQIEFILRGIPYQVREEDNILGNDTLKRLLSLLRVRAAIQAGMRPDLEDELETISAYFRRGIRASEAAEVRQLLTGPHDLLRVLRSDGFREAVPKSGGGIVDAVARLTGTAGLTEAFAVAAADFAGLRGMVGSLEDAIDQRVPLAEIGEVAFAFGEDAGEFVATMERSLAVAAAARAGHSPEGVGLLTYFKSKGRQWHTVILTSCNEGLIPHWNAEVEDERRLFYVALTRAEANLMISYVSHAISRPLRPSRFLFEAGLLEGEDGTGADVDDGPIDTEAIRALLAEVEAHLLELDAFGSAGANPEVRTPPALGSLSRPELGSAARVSPPSESRFIDGALSVTVGIPSTERLIACDIQADGFLSLHDSPGVEASAIVFRFRELAEKPLWTAGLPEQRAPRGQYEPVSLPLLMALIGSSALTPDEVGERRRNLARRYGLELDLPALEPAPSVDGGDQVADDEPDRVGGTEASRREHDDIRWAVDSSVDPASVQPGCTVRHASYGRGTVVSVRRGRLSTTVRVEFSRDTREVLFGAGHLDFVVE
jgi:ATP-dependent DNA helicase UvrD/PcrA